MDERPHPDRTRRDGVESVSIRLADGQLWGLALPTPRLKPKFVRGVDSLGRPTETIEVESEYGYPLEIRRLLDDLRDACERGRAAKQHNALFLLAASLIRRVHEIDLEDVAGLLEIDLQELPGFVATVLSVVTGEAFDHAASHRKKDADV